MRRMLLIGALVIAAAGVVVFLTRSPAPSGDVQVHEVREEEFVRRVSGEGNLRAIESTPLAPSRLGGSWGPMKIAWLAADGTPVKAGDVVARFDPTDYEKQLKDGLDDRRSAEARLRKERVQGEAARKSRQTTATLAELELDQTRRFRQKDPDLFSRNQIIESEVDETLSEARKKHADATRRIETELTQSKSELIEIDRQKADLSVSQAKAGLEALEIRAPHDGTLALQRDRTGNLPRVGQQVWPGETIATIPKLDGLEAELFVLEADGGGLKEGQPATVTVEAWPDEVHLGKVKRVEKLARPRQRGLPVQYFGVIVSLDKTDPAHMKPGQRVRGTITLDERKALVVPRQAVFEKDGQKVVYRAGRRSETAPSGFEPVQVTLGEGSFGRIVVEKGLAAGDRVALRDPTRRDAEPKKDRANGAKAVP